MPVVSHGDPVIHGNRVELEGHAAGRPHGSFDQLPKFLQVHMPWDDIDVRIDHGDEGFIHIRIGHTHCFQQRPVGGTFKPGLIKFEGIARLLLLFLGERIKKNHPGVGWLFLVYVRLLSVCLATGLLLF